MHHVRISGQKSDTYRCTQMHSEKFEYFQHPLLPTPNLLVVQIRAQTCWTNPAFGSSRLVRTSCSSFRLRIRPKQSAVAASVLLRNPLERPPEFETQTYRRQTLGPRRSSIPASNTNSVWT